MLCKPLALSQVRRSVLIYRYIQASTRVRLDTLYDHFFLLTPPSPLRSVTPGNIFLKIFHISWRLVFILSAVSNRNLRINIFIQLVQTMFNSNTSKLSTRINCLQQLSMPRLFSNSVRSWLNGTPALLWLGGSVTIIVMTKFADGLSRVSVEGLDTSRIYEGMRP